MARWWFAGAPPIGYILARRSAAGGALGDIIAEFAVFAEFGIVLTIAGQALYPEHIADYVVALLPGIVFQYFPIAPMRAPGMHCGPFEVANADILSLIAFEVGLFGWTALTTFVFFPNPGIEPGSPVHRFLMRLGMVLEFATAWPANARPLRRAIQGTM